MLHHDGRGTDYVGTLYSSRIEASNDPSSLLAVYRALVRHLAVFGVEIADPALYPQFIAEYATPAEGAAAAGRGGDDVIDGLLSVRLAARRVKEFAKADAMRNLLNEVGVHIEDTPQGTRWTER